MANILRVSFDSKDEWPVKDVTVYTTRAQVVRILDYKTTDAGEAELKLTNLPTTILHDSIRAEVSSQNANVLEVASEVVVGEAGIVVVSDREREITDIINGLSKERGVIGSRKIMLNSYENSMIPKAKLTKKDNSLFENFSSEENLQLFSSSLETYSSELKKLSLRELAIDREIHNLRKEKRKMETENQSKSQETVRSTTDVSVLINVPEQTVEETGIVEVKLTYVVNECSWKANYDIRVNKEDNVVDLAYYGQVKNGSGEDWQEVQMYLSTAKPSRAGVLPDLPRANVKYIPKARVREVRSKARFGRNRKMKKRAYALEDVEEDDEEIDDAASICYDAGAPMMQQKMFVAELDTLEVEEELQEIAQVDQSTAEDRGGSATFKLNRLCSIESDSIEHKQKISNIVLTPHFTYVVSPQVSAFCFLRCHALNDSNFIFVRGPMSVFFNGSFVTTTEMKLVNKNQEFKVYLGKDESIKLQINPSISKKEQTKGGIMTSKVNKESFSRTVKVENTRGEDVEVLLYEQVPLARDNKIKVDILSPNIEKDTKREIYNINFLSQLEVKRKLKKGKTWDFTFAYKVEWPKNQEIIYTQSLENLDV